MMKWISVKENFPDENDLVLITCGSYIYIAEFFNLKKLSHIDKNPRIIKNQFIIDNDKYIFMCNEKYPMEVTHWMELPEPPKD